MDPRWLLRLLLPIIFIGMVLQLFTGSGQQQGQTPAQPPLTTADLPYPEFARYFGAARVARITIFIAPEVQARETENARVVYVTTLTPSTLNAFAALAAGRRSGALVLTRDPSAFAPPTPHGYTRDPAGNPTPSNQPVEFKRISAPEFLRKFGDGTFRRVTVLYIDTVFVTLKGAAFETIRYRVRLPEHFANPSGDIVNVAVNDQRQRAELVALALAPTPNIPWRIIALALAVAAAGLFLWRKINSEGQQFRAYRHEHQHPTTPPPQDGKDGTVVPNDPLQNPIPSGPPQVTFADIGGQEEAVQDAKEIVAFLRDPRKFLRVGAKIPRGALLVGPPGTGKTLLGRAIAGEAGVPFIYVSGSEFIEMYVGVGASRIRDLFKKARQEAARHPSHYAIVFIDEIDAVGSKRTAGDRGGDKEYNQTINQLLTEIDGFAPASNIFVIGATNRMDILDPALIRRLTRKIYMSLPDRKGREAILKIHMRSRNFDPSVTPQQFAKKTPLGFSGDDLQNAVNEAAISAARNGRERITWEDVQEGITRTMMGAARKSRILSAKEKVEVAYHESGHHYVRWFLHRNDAAHTDPPGTVTIIGRGMSLGYSSALEEEERFLWDERYLKNQLTIAVAGRVAEELFFDTKTSGASNDFEQATEIAIKMITKWIMGDREGLPPLTLGRRGAGASMDSSKHREYSDETAKIIDDRAGALVEDAMRAARLILELGRDEVERLAAALIEQETIEAEELDAVILGVPAPTGAETAVMQERFAKVKDVAKWLAKPLVWPVKQLAALTGPTTKRH